MFLCISRASARGALLQARAASGVVRSAYARPSSRRTFPRGSFALESSPLNMGKRRHVDVGDAAMEEVTVHGLFDIANTATPNDNCAIALRMLPAGTAFRMEAGGRVYKLSHQILEGHRFAIREMDVGASLMSWGLPFGKTIKRMNIGDYIMNQLMRTALDGRREVTWELPTPNFKDLDSSIHGAFQLDEKQFTPLKSQKASKQSKHTFMGYSREDGMVGTRNYIGVIAVTVNASRFARAAVTEVKKSSIPSFDAFPNVDGVCCVAHNEGGGEEHINNVDLVLRALSSYLVHPNLGGVLVVSSPQDKHVTAKALRAVLAERHPEAIGKPSIVFQELTENWVGDKAAACATIEHLVKTSNAKDKRTPQPLSALRIALQCGGSDSFSGITGNPLAGAVAKELIEAGGAAVLAETPELVGAEPYITSGCASLEVAQNFMRIIHRFQAYADRHNQNAAGNPSGGNLFRGLYNIAIKSLGASRKKPPSVALDGCLEWAQRITDPGYYFMDSPGNDLESIAGQVATGCNMIYFITGNGAITNFPFVPTLKYVTTSGRFNLLSNDMDIDAGELNRADVTMAMKAEKTMALTLAVAGGQKSKGEAAGHAQVNMWRNWAVKAGNHVSDTFEKGFNHFQRQLDKQPLATSTFDVDDVDRDFFKWVPDVTSVAKGRKLVLPTSLCSSAIGDLAVKRLAEKNPDTQYACIPHTEGCCASGGEQLENMIARSLCGHALHPLVDATFVLEHGCEKTHNDWFLSKVGPEKEGQFGWGSVQKDGGIENNVEKIERFFNSAAPWKKNTPLMLGIRSAKADVGDDAARFLAVLCKKTVALGGKVVIPQRGAEGVLGNNAFIAELLQDNQPGLTIEPTLAYAEIGTAGSPGVHIMQTDVVMSDVEITSGLAACGASAIVNWTSAGLRVSHLFVPTLNVGTDGDCDVVVSGDDVADQDGGAGVVKILEAVKYTIAGEVTSKAQMTGCVDFSIPRGTAAVTL